MSGLRCVVCDQDSDGRDTCPSCEEREAKHRFMENERSRHEGDGPRDVMEAEQLLDRALAILRVFQSEHLGDSVYDVKEREGLGWDGPRVKAWSDACRDMDALLEELPAPAAADTEVKP